MIKITQLGDIYRNTESINNHSIKTFVVDVPMWENQRFCLDKTTDGSPAFYELFTYSAVGEGFPTFAFTTTIKVNGERYWGDGLTWKQAENEARHAIVAWIKEQENE